MTARADAVRDRRRGFAAPGGRHDRLVRRLVLILPALLMVVAAIMVFAPLGPRGEVSFLLDRNKVAQTADRIDVENARYRGTDNRGRLFEVTAGRAVQPAADKPVVGMNNLFARLNLRDGPARVEATNGSYNFATNVVSSSRPLTFTAADGYHMALNNVSIDLRTQQARGAGGVTGTGPAGVFQADQVVADLDNRSVALIGRARLRMVPGKAGMPK